MALETLKMPTDIAPSPDVPLVGIFPAKGDGELDEDTLSRGSGLAAQAPCMGSCPPPPAMRRLEA